MSATILVGVDDRATARDAVALGAALASAHGHKLAIVNVYPVDLLAGSPGAGAPWEQPMRSEACDTIHRAAAGCPMPYEPVVIAYPSTVGGLHEAAERTDATMLVVGSSHRGAVGRVTLGSHTERVLHGAPCAVAVAPHGLAAAEWAPKRIAVAYDGSRDARHAIAVGRRLAAAAGARLLIVTAVDHDPGPSRRFHDGPVWRAEERELIHAAEGSLAEVAAEGEHTDVRLGEPVEQLLMLSYGTDLLVLGSRGYGALRRVLAGATAHRVVREAACPVVVVPRSAREHAGAAEEAVTAAGA